MLKLKVNIPQLRFRILNERETVEAMAAQVATMVKQRAQSGDGLPAPKDGGRPYNRTGTLTASIGYGEPKQNKAGNWRAVVRAFGQRPAVENVKAKVSRAREKTKALKAAAIIGASLRSLSTETTHSKGKAGTFRGLSRIRVRAAKDNAALAGILSQPPKDKRSIAGGRKQYRVFEPRKSEVDAAQRVASKTIKPSLDKR